GRAELRGGLLRPEGRAGAEGRRRQMAERRTKERSELLADIEKQGKRYPFKPLALMGALVRAMPPDTVVVEEAITTHHNVFERLGVLRDPRHFFAQRGWALGWGVGCAIGVKLAWPDRPVLALLGDGAALYGIQGLWSAAHHQVPVTFVICNNSQYRILKVCGDVMNLPALREPDCPGLDVDAPPVDFVGLARAFGVPSLGTLDLDQLTERVRTSLRGDVPQLFDVTLAH